MTATPDALLREELDNARRVSAESRSAITQKLEVLEGRVQETVAEVKQNFDFDYQMQQRPWLMVGGSLLVGYTLAWLVSAPRTATTSRASVSDPPPRPRAANESRTPTHDRVASITGDVLDVVTGTLWAMAKQGLLPPETQFGKADASQPARPFNPPLTNVIDEGKPSNGHSTL